VFGIFKVASINLAAWTTVICRVCNR
jgi:hypothetical protein